MHCEQVEVFKLSIFMKTRKMIKLVPSPKLERRRKMKNKGYLEIRTTSTDDSTQDEKAILEVVCRK